MSRGLFINGAWRSGQGPALTSIDPATGAPVWEGATATPSDVAEAVTAARAAFQDWADRPRSERILAARSRSAWACRSRSIDSQTSSPGTASVRSISPSTSPRALTSIVRRPGTARRADSSADSIPPFP